MILLNDFKINLMSNANKHTVINELTYESKLTNLGRIQYKRKYRLRIYKVKTPEKRAYT